VLVRGRPATSRACPARAHHRLQPGVHRRLGHPPAVHLRRRQPLPAACLVGCATGAAELALVVDDPDAPRGTYVHWLIVGIDPASTTLAEATVPPGVRQVRNSAGKAAYTGPCPPGGPAHHYRFTIYALQRPPGRRRRRQPRDVDPGHRGGRHRPRAVGWHRRPLTERVSLSSYRGPDPAQGSLRKPSPRGPSAAHPARYQPEQDAATPRNRTRPHQHARTP
jgi:hypothetical protein